jgi:hypothetical protein
MAVMFLWFCACNHSTYIDQRSLDYAVSYANNQKTAFEARQKSAEEIVDLFDPDGGYYNNHVMALKVAQDANALKSLTYLHSKGIKIRVLEHVLEPGGRVKFEGGTLCIDANVTPGQITDYLYDLAAD